MATLKNLVGSLAGFHEKPLGIQKGMINTIRENRRKKPPRKPNASGVGRPAKPKTKDFLAGLTPEEKAILKTKLEKGS